MFETERLLLRVINLDTDLNTLVQWQNNADFRTLASSQPIVGKAPDTVKAMFKPRAPDTLPILAICLKPATYPLQLQPGDDYFKACGLPIGVINFQPGPGWDFKNRTATLALLFPDVTNRGKGYGTEVLEWGMRYAFAELGLHRVQLTVYDFNEAAIKLYRKVGFVEEGRLRKVYFKSGRWHDGIEMAMLEEEWFERQQT